MSLLHATLCFIIKYSAYLQVLMYFLCFKPTTQVIAVKGNTTEICLLPGMELLYALSYFRLHISGQKCVIYSSNTGYKNACNGIQ